MADLDLAQLDELAKAATPGPWIAEADESATKDGPKYPSSAAVMVYADRDCEHHPIADFSCNHTCRMEWDCEANAKFAAALVSQWPAIREALRKPVPYSPYVDGRFVP